jgi:hypothetical protein
LKSRTALMTSSSRTADRSVLLYSQRSTSFFPPVGNCFGYVANEWLTLSGAGQDRSKVGDVFQNSYVTLWGAREGRPSELISRGVPIASTPEPH